MKWTNPEVMDRMSEYFTLRNGKFLITLPGLNRLLMDPRCPEPQRSNLVEYLVKVRTQLEAKQGK